MADDQAKNEAIAHALINSSTISIVTDTGDEAGKSTPGISFKLPFKIETDDVRIYAAMNDAIERKLKNLGNVHITGGSWQNEGNGTSYSVSLKNSPEEIKKIAAQLGVDQFGASEKAELSTPRLHTPVNIPKGQIAK